MLKLVKFGGVTLTAGAVVGVSVVAWLYSHRLDGVDASTANVPIAQVATNGLPSDGLASGSGASATPGLSVVNTNSSNTQGAVLGASQGSLATPTPQAGSSSAATNRPGPSDFKQYDQYKSVTDKVFSVDIQKGSGAAVKQDDKIVVRYTGWLTDGTVFDTTEKSSDSKPVEFALTQGKLIAGWVTGLQGMQAGGVRRLIVPPAAGYGDTPQNGIPAGSVLIFDVQLVSITP